MGYKLMPKRLVGPFSELQGLPPIDVNTADDLDILERMDLLNRALAVNNCNCNGYHSGLQRDPYFGADISELISRCTPHDVYHVGDDGRQIAETVSIKIGTLLAEVDSNGEVCAWMYEESEPVIE